MPQDLTPRDRRESRGRITPTSPECRGQAAGNPDGCHPDHQLRSRDDPIATPPNVKFPQSFIDEVRSAADIVTVISDYVSLRKAGTSYKGLCPFHGEKSPSFNVNRDRGFFHCFGCGVGGDVFKFVELKEQLGFQDAVRQLAQRFGIPVPDLETSDGARDDAAARESLLKIHEVAAAYYRAQLESPPGGPHSRLPAEGARAHRGNDRSPAAWLGAAGARWAAAAPRQSGLSPAGMISQRPGQRRDDGDEVDRFRNRLMVPIASDAGSIIAFGGRALEKDQVPKYLNSPETPIYSKSRTLYGLNLTKGDLRKTRLHHHRRGLLRLRAGVSRLGAAGGGDLRHRAHHRSRRRAAALRAEGGHQLRPGHGRPDRRRASRASCWSSEGFDVNVVRLPAATTPTRSSRSTAATASWRAEASKPYLEFLLDRAAAEHKPHPRRPAGVSSCARCWRGGAHPGPGHPRPVRRPAGAQGPGHRRGGARRDSQGGRRPEDRPCRPRACRRRQVTRDRARLVVGAHPRSGEPWCPGSKHWKMMTWKDLALQGLLQMARDLEVADAADVAKCPHGASNTIRGPDGWRPGSPSLGSSPRRRAASGADQAPAGRAGIVGDPARRRPARRNTVRKGQTY